MSLGADSFDASLAAVPLGGRSRLDLPIAEPYGMGSLSVPVHVVRGKKPGPALFVSAAIHGDEINGVEIIRRLLGHRSLRRISGSLIAVPVVNVYGFMSQSRYLPDRRDLNRSFPGSPTGSLASRLAAAFMTHVVKASTHGIDLHTATTYRSNLPQVRATLDRPETRALAAAFGAPVVIDANVRDGSLRQAVTEEGIPMLLYEAGEALRFDEVAIRAGLRGILRCMVEIGMLPASMGPRTSVEPVVARRSTWLRAPSSGLLRSRLRLGSHVEPGEVLGCLSDPAGEQKNEILSTVRGVLIGRTETPLLNEGDAAFHIAVFDESAEAADTVEAFQNELDPDDAGGAA